jgi:hypothetical protein
MIISGQEKRLKTMASAQIKTTMTDVSTRTCAFAACSLPGCGIPAVGATATDTLTMRQLVTEVDQAVETFIKDSIKARYPSHRLYVFCKGACSTDGRLILEHSLGEETYAEDGKMELTDEYTWIVDPIDGRPLPRQLRA